MGGIAHFLHYWLGLSTPNQEPYLFWSGFGSDLGEATLLGAFIAAYRHRNCHVKGCWRLGHPDPEHNFPACRKHHSRGEALGASQSQAPREAE